MATDAELVEGSLRGDVRAFERIMRAHNQRLFRVVRAIVRDDADAEDVLQQTYLKAYRALESFRGDSKLSTWLTRIAIHVALRRASNRRDHSELEDTLGATAPTPEENAMQAELRTALESAIDQLDVRYRLVLVMRDVQGMSTRETSTCLAVSEEAVRVRLHRARRLLRTRLEDRLDLSAGDAFAFAGDRCDRIVAGVLTQLRARARGDESLVRSVAAGDRGALGELFDRHSSAVYALVLPRAHERTEDVVHHAFLELWRRAHRVPGAGVREWLAARACESC